MHQIGQTEIMPYLAHNATSTVFLLPCYSTPGTSHVHQKVTMTVLTCPPTGYNPSKRFLENPLSFAQELTTKYNRVVTYSGFAETLKEWLDQEQMVRTVDIPNSRFCIDGINNTRVQMFERRK
jgi:phosphatidylinositol glycan class B